MKIITCASYYGSGSSALTDLVAEYDSVKDLSDFEFRFLHCLDGVSDLEYNIVSNHNRANAGHALKRFQRMSEFNNGCIISKRYSRFFKNNAYIDLTNRYIEALLDFKYEGYNFYDLYDRGPKMYYFFQFLIRVARRTGVKWINPLRKEETYCSHKSEEAFLLATREYISGLLQELNPEKKIILKLIR